MKKIVRSLVRRLGFEITRVEPAGRVDVSPGERAVIERVGAYTATTPERILALLDAVGYVVGAGVPGAIVECGVWKGGSVMACALALQSLGAPERELYLFDTFEGMVEPTEHDVCAVNEEPAGGEYAKLRRTRDSSDWYRVPLEEVRRNVASVGYPPARLHFVKGRVEQTLPAAAPAQIALLRLDTDWYASTRHELHHLYPRLAPGGVLLVDDYGHWRGSRRAVDEYFEEHPPRPLLARVDYTGRMGVKRG